MTRFVDIDDLSADPEQTAADALRSIDIYTPTIENLLRRLAEAHAPERHAQRSFHLGSWAIVAAVMASLCVPGGSAAAIFLMKARTSDRAPAAQALAKTDQLERPEAAMRADNSTDEKQAPFQETLNIADLLEPITFRGSIETASPREASPAPPPSHKRKLKGTTSLVPPPEPDESPRPAPQSPSFLDRLFGTSVFVTSTPPQT
jgi:hypothetical protein